MKWLMISMLQFKLGDEVFLMNPRAHRQKLAAAVISGLPGDSTFHFKQIPDSWVKVDVRDILHAGVPLMFPYEEADMTVIEHAKGSAAMWDTKYIKLST
jgi:hypothetical protein